MPSINLFLNFDGNCKEAFEFYSKVFGRSFLECQTFGQIPDETPIPETEKDKILYVALPINDQTVLMGCDISSAFGHQPIKLGDNISISLEANTETEARYLYHELASEAQSQIPLQKTFWGSLFGIVTDNFGIQWMINYKLPE